MWVIYRTKSRVSAKPVKSVLHYLIISQTDDMTTGMPYERSGMPVVSIMERDAFPPAVRSHIGITDSSPEERDAPRGRCRCRRRRD